MIKPCYVYITFVSTLGLNSCDAARIETPPPPSLSKGAILSAACSSCHIGGNKDGMPNIDGLSAVKLSTSLLHYKQDLDGTTVMHRLARGYSEADIALISDYLGKK